MGPSRSAFSEASVLAERILRRELSIEPVPSRLAPDVPWPLASDRCGAFAVVTFAVMQPGDVPSWWCIASTQRLTDGVWVDCGDDDVRMSDDPMHRPVVDDDWTAWHAHGSFKTFESPSRTISCLFGVASSATARLVLESRSGTRDLAMSASSGAYAGVVTEMPARLLAIADGRLLADVAVGVR